MNKSPVSVFTTLLVNLNVLVPVLHLGCESSVGSGIAKVPEAEPFVSVVNAAPS